MKGIKRMFERWFRKMFPFIVVALLANFGATLAGSPHAWAEEAPPTYAGQWSTINGSVWYEGPQGIASDTTGNVYVVDTYNEDLGSGSFAPHGRCQKFSANGNPLGGWWLGTISGYHVHPYAIAINNNGNIYISNQIAIPLYWQSTGWGGGYWVYDYEYFLQKFGPGGNLMLQYQKGSGESQVSRPQGLAVDWQNNVYVSDGYSIKKFNSNDQFVTKWGSYGFEPGKFDLPSGIAVDFTGNAYVVDENNRRIQKFTENGSFKTAWSVTNPGKIAVGKSGNVYVVDYSLNRIKKFDTNGNFLCQWGDSGSDNGFFNRIAGIALGLEGKIYVLDKYNHRVQVFQINIQAVANPDNQNVVEGALVTLNGANSTPQSEIATYRWEKISGPDVTLTNATSSQATFNAPTQGPATLQFRLTVTSYDNVTSQATCVVNVTHENQPPTAEAGDYPPVDEQTFVTLQGSGSDPEGGTLTYSWTQVGEPTVTLSNANTATPSFTAPAVGPGGSVALTFKLTVTDAEGAQATDTCIVNVSHVNQPPTADAGVNKTVNGGVPVTLNGSGTDPEEAQLTFRWTQKKGPSVTLSNAESAAASFTAPNVTRDEDLVFELTVSDGSLQGKAECTVTVRFVNTAPVAKAGGNVRIDSGEKNATVLQGTASDADAWQSLNYRWLEGDTALSDPLPVVDGKAPLALGVVSLGVGGHTLTLEVDDGCGGITRDTMELAIGNSPPTVAATGGGTYEVGNAVTLGGSILDYDGGEMSYEWREGDKVLQSSSVSAKPETIVYLDNFNITTLPLGVHNLTLQVTDGNNTPSITISVTIQDSQKPTLAPLADRTILWPPDKAMVPVTIRANAADNSGQPPALTASVSCNELLGPGVVEWTEPVIDQSAGIITLNLRADRFGKGKGRVYTIAITATDAGGNVNTANVTVSVPHDQGKK